MKAKVKEAPVADIGEPQREIEVWPLVELAPTEAPVETPTPERRPA